MKIASADVAMGSTRVFTELDSTREKLRAWVGKNPDSVPQGIRDRVVLGANAPPPPQQLSEPEEGCLGSCKGSRSEEDEEVSAQDGYIYVLKKTIEKLMGKKISMRRVQPVEVERASTPNLPREALRQGRQGWGVEYDRTSTHYESEQTTFAAEGVIKTADGQEINFSLKLEMSREFLASESESIRAGDAAKVDPLVLNFGGNAAELTDTKFAFDLDQDGTEEHISFVGSGSGILVFDRNQDGTVNDGGELFGPTSGNGFEELSALDGDENGWIDENDPAYQDLSVWTRTEDGADTLTGLKAKNVGAIYLGNVQTQFDLMSGGTLNGQVARTGIFAEEDGAVGTIQQVDLVT